MVRRGLYLLMALFLALMSWATPSTSNVPGDPNAWMLLGFVSAAAFGWYAVRPSANVFDLAIATWLVQGVPRGLAWALDSIWAPAAIWGAWTMAMMLLWTDRSRQSEA